MLQYILVLCAVMAVIGEPVLEKLAFGAEPVARNPLGMRAVHRPQPHQLGLDHTSVRLLAGIA